MVGVGTTAMAATTLPQAWLAHACSGRARLRIPDRRHDGNYFALVANTLRANDAIVTAEFNPATASLVIRHRGELASVAQFAATSGLFALVSSTPVGESALRSASDGLRTISGAVQGMTNGVLDAPSLAYAGLVGLAVVQALRGHVAGPATTLLWNALTLVQIGDLAKQVTRAVSRAGPR